jgi:hypothetical protein
MLLRRVLSFVIDLSFWLFFAFVISRYTPSSFLFITFILLFLFLFLSSWKLQGLSPGNFIFRLKLINIRNNNKISFLQALLRIFLLFLDGSSFFLLNFGINKKNQYQSFVETFSKTAIVPYNSNDLNIVPLENNKLFKKIFYISFLFGIILFTFYKIIVLDFYDASKEIRNEFDLMIESNLKNQYFLDTKKNDLIKDCIWGGDDDFIPFPIFKLYWSDKKDRKPILSKLNDSFDFCIQEYYSDDELIKAIKKMRLK